MKDDERICNRHFFRQFFKSHSAQQLFSVAFWNLPLQLILPKSFRTHVFIPEPNSTAHITSTQTGNVQNSTGMADCRAKFNYSDYRILPGFPASVKALVRSVLWSSLILPHAVNPLQPLDPSGPEIFCFITRQNKFAVCTRDYSI